MAHPYGGLTLGTDGYFYGTTTSGGIGRGTIFRIASTGELTTLHAFSAFEGGIPYAPPVQGAKAFYGVTAEGTAYSITSAGTFKLFKDQLPGGSSAPLILATNGKFYGTTFNGGTHKQGTVLQLSANGAVEILYNFDTTHGTGPRRYCGDRS